MNCDDSRTYLDAYLDDELGVAESLGVQKHLILCADCRQSQQEQLALRSALRDPEMYSQPSDDFARRIEEVVRRAARQEAQSERSAWFEWLRLGTFRWVPAAAAVIVVATMGVLFVMNRMQASHEQLIASSVLAGHI